MHVFGRVSRIHTEDLPGAARIRNNGCPAVRAEETPGSDACLKHAILNELPVCAIRIFDDANVVDQHSAAFDEAEDELISSGWIVAERRCRGVLESVSLP